MSPVYVFSVNMSVLCLLFRCLVLTRACCVSMCSGQRNVDIRVEASPSNPRADETVELKCLVSGNTRAGVAWTRYGGSLPPQARQFNERLRIPNLRADDGGIYVCTVTTPNGVFEETYALVIQSTLILPTTVLSFVRSPLKYCCSRHYCMLG